MSRATAFFCASALAAATCAASCGGATTETSVVGPDVPRCQLAVSADPRNVEPGGGTVAVRVDAARDCTWTASTQAGWIRLDAASGQGSAQLTAAVAPNEQPAPRTGDILVNEARATISQEPRPCRYQLRDDTVDIGAEGGRGSVQLEADADCPWTASSSVDWVRVLTTSGRGSGRIEFEVSANGGEARSTTLTVAGVRLGIAQQASAAHRQARCTFSISPASAEVGALGGEGRFRMNTQEGCEWSASSNDAWISASGGTSGPGDVVYRVLTNPGMVPRSGSVAAGGQRHSVTQAASARVCEYILTPLSRQFPASGGRGDFHVTSPAACRWAPQGGASWVIVSSSSDDGDGDVAYVVQPNTGAAARSTTINVGGQVHTITQAGASAASNR